MGEGSEFLSLSTCKKLLVLMEASPKFVDDSCGSAEKPSGGVMPGSGWETYLEVRMTASHSPLDPPPHQLSSAPALSGSSE